MGNDGSGNDSVQCHTDLDTCCRRVHGPHRGDWYFPNGDLLPFGNGSNIIRIRQAQRVDLRCSRRTGIYRCDIATVAVHDNGMRETVYVGLYTRNGGKVYNTLYILYINGEVCM